MKWGVPTQNADWRPSASAAAWALRCASNDSGRIAPAPMACQPRQICTRGCLACECAASSERVLDVGGAEVELLGAGDVAVNELTQPLALAAGNSIDHGEMLGDGDLAQFFIGEGAGAYRMGREGVVQYRVRQLLVAC